jgi:hypothetical protein
MIAIIDGKATNKQKTNKKTDQLPSINSQEISKPRSKDPKS